MTLTASEHLRLLQLINYGALDQSQWEERFRLEAKRDSPLPSSEPNTFPSSGAVFKAAHQGEGDPSVMPDCAAPETSSEPNTGGWPSEEEIARVIAQTLDSGLPDDVFEWRWKYDGLTFNRGRLNQAAGAVKELFVVHSLPGKK